MKIVCPYKSLSLTKGKQYFVHKDYGHGDVEIKNDAGDMIPVNTAKSAWTFEQAWKVIK
jgi:hypothetical protein